MAHARRLAVAATLLWLSSPGQVAGLPPIRTESRVVLDFDVVLVAPQSDGKTISERSLELDAARPASSKVDLEWPGSTRPAILTVSATGRPGIDDDEQDVRADSALLLPDGQIVRADWTIRIRDGTSRLVEAYAKDGVRVLLAFRAERVSRPVVAGSTPRLTTQVRFRLEILRTQGETAIPLETNVLDTFLGEPVEYSFERGQDDDLEALRISLLPLRLDGDVAEVQADIDGTLPGAPNRVVVSRRERLLTTRGSASSLTVAAGDPPLGYKFVLRPDW